MSHNIFLSVGRTSTSEQENFVRSIEKYLESNDLKPLTVGRTYYKNQQPLKSVEECLKECSGTLIIAFERTYIERGIEKRGSQNEMTLANSCLPTVWNQIEAAMSYALGMPILVVVENGIKSEGLLEKGYDWYVTWVNITDSILSNTEFIGIFNDWKKRAEQFNLKESKTETKQLETENLTIGQILNSLKPSQLWAIGTAFVTLLAGVAAIAYKIGTIAPK